MLLLVFGIFCLVVSAFVINNILCNLFYRTLGIYHKVANVIMGALWGIGPALLAWHFYPEHVLTGSVLWVVLFLLFHRTWRRVYLIPVER